MNNVDFSPTLEYRRREIGEEDEAVRRALSPTRPENTEQSLPTHTHYRRFWSGSFRCEWSFGEGLESRQRHE